MAKTHQPSLSRMNDEVLTRQKTSKIPPHIAGVEIDRDVFRNSLTQNEFGRLLRSKDGFGHSPLTALSCFVRGICGIFFAPLDSLVQILTLLPLRQMLWLQSMPPTICGGSGCICLVSQTHSFSQENVPSRVGIPPGFFRKIEGNPRANSRMRLIQL